MEEKKNKGGRPTKYREEMCEKAEALFSEGASIYEVCRELDIYKDAFYDYVAKYPEFSDAVKKGLDKSQAWWEKQGRIALREKEFNATLWYMNMKNRFRKDWMERSEKKVEHSGSMSLSGLFDAANNDK